MKHVKKLISIILCMILFALPIQSVTASYLGSLSCWNSEQTLVLYLRKGVLSHSSGNYYCYWTIEYYAGSLLHMQRVTAAASNAASGWTNNLGLVLVQSSVSNPVITVFTGGSDAIDYYYPSAYMEHTITDQTLGITKQSYTGNYSHTAYYLGTTYNVSGMDYAQVFPLYTDNTLSEYYNIIAHEFGHALGYYGHNNDSSALMHKYTTAFTSPQSADIAHLSQIYAYTLSNAVTQ